jgi:futalosine hydrolase
MYGMIKRRVRKKKSLNFRLSRERFPGMKGGPTMSSIPMRSDILIVAAVEAELSPLEKRVSKPSALRIGGRKGISGHIAGLPVRMVETGPGLVNAVQAVTAAVESERPGLIIQTGCAGVFRASGLKIGDIGIADIEIDAHLGIARNGEKEPLGDLPFSVVGTVDGGAFFNRYPLDPVWSARALSRIREQFAGSDVTIRKGAFLTVSTLPASAAAADALGVNHAAMMENMEGSGIAHLAIHYDLPFVEIRSGSNFAGERDRNLWNLPLAFERAAEAVSALLLGQKAGSLRRSKEAG